MQVAGLVLLYVDIDSGAGGRPCWRPGPARGRRDAPRPSPRPLRRERSSRASSRKWYREVCLLEQPFRDEERSVRDLVTEKIATIGENIRVRRFTRYALGEEL